MMKYLTPIFLFLGLACGVADAGKKAPASKVYQKQLDVIKQMAEDFPEVAVTVEWTVCGQFNSAYYPVSDAIVLCTETEEKPDAAIWVAAHEMGHAITDQYIGLLTEDSADQVATIWLLEHGYQDAVSGAAEWFMEGINNPHYPDEHASDKFRAVYLILMTDGFNRPDGELGDFYRGQVAYWQVRFQTDRLTPEDSILDLFKDLED